MASKSVEHFKQDARLWHAEKRQTDRPR